MHAPTDWSFNRYEFSKFNRESGAESYFTMPRLQKITKVISCRAPRFVNG